MDRRIQKALEMMLADGKKEGLPLMVCSAYRDYQKQDQLMDNSIAKFVRGGMSYKDAFSRRRKKSPSPVRASITPVSPWIS